MKKLALGLALLSAGACSPTMNNTVDGGDVVAADATMEAGPMPEAGTGEGGASEAGPDAPTGPLPDITVDSDALSRNLQFAMQYFPANSCELTEQCVRAPGWRRLLMFSTLTTNQGDADLVLGTSSSGNPNFMYNACHNHYHFQGYADYQLLTSDGGVAAMGHKQSFCVEDLVRVVDDPATPRNPRYNNCGYSGGVQGIQRGWADDYYPDLPCQWIDVTDVPAGSYRVRVTINGMHRFTESNYDNNSAEVTVTIPASFDLVASNPPTRACTATDPEQGVGRDCGWRVFDTVGQQCTPGQTISVGCNDANNLGHCVGSYDIRICEGSTTCLGGDARRVLQQDYGNASTGTWRLENTCPLATFTCPPSGRYTVMYAPDFVGDTSGTCRIATRVEGADGGVSEAGTSDATAEAGSTDAGGGG